MVKLSDIDLPVTFKKHLLFKSGNWNGWDIKADEVNKSVSNTKWNKINSSLIYSHKDNEAEAWIGNVKNITSENGATYGDLEIWDPDTALKAKYGEAAFAVSAGIAWPDRFEQPTNFFYRNFSLVTNPGVAEKDIFLNFAAKEQVGEYKTAIFSSSLNEIAEADNVPKEVAAEQITPLENVNIETKEKVSLGTTNPEQVLEIKPIEEQKEMIEVPKTESPAAKLAQEILDTTLQENNINEMRLQEESSMENEKEVQINEPVAEKKEVKDEAQPIVSEQPEKIVNASPAVSPEFDEKLVDSIANKLAEKINIQSSPAPVTTQEFGGEVIKSEDAVVDRLVTDLFKE
jgi:hypothetical protein